MPGVRTLVEFADQGEHALATERLEVVDLGRGPISGAGSSFQSPVCRTLPSGVRRASAWDSGIEWVTWISEQSNGPT